MVGPFISHEGKNVESIEEFEDGHQERDSDDDALTPNVVRLKRRPRRRPRYISSTDTSTTEESEDSDPEINTDDDALAEDIEITEGGWICRVERFEKHVDSQRRIIYRHPPKKSSAPPANQDFKDARKAETLEQGKIKKDVQQSIILYIRHIPKTSSRRDLIEPEVFIKINSPLIREVLLYLGYGKQV